MVYKTEQVYLLVANAQFVKPEVMMFISRGSCLMSFERIFKRYKYM